MYTFTRLGNHGRLGNQLFQIAAVMGAAASNNTEYVIPDWSYARVFKGPFNMATEPIHTDYVYNEASKGFHFNPVPHEDNAVIDLVGYFQSYRYFSAISDEVVTALTPTVSALSPEKTSCAVHFRHGDTFDRATKGGHVNNEDFHPVMPPAYYKKALELTRQAGAERFYIFYDHPETKKWVEAHRLLNGLPHTYVENQSNVQDLKTMSLCDFAIIANSSFSWWGAYLQRRSKSILCPHHGRWFGPRYAGHKTHDLFPPNWVEVNWS